MYFVYVLKSKKFEHKTYVGITKELDRRLQEHNKGVDTYTKDYLPWQIETFVAFRNKEKAYNFEKYLKHGSGHAFLKKRLLP